MENFDMMVAQNINDLLNEKGKKQSELAKFLNLPRQTVNKMLTGKRNILANEINQIATFFNCKIDNLVKKNTFVDTNVHAFFMGENFDNKTKQLMSKLYDLSDIIVEQQYLNDNKE